MIQLLLSLDVQEQLVRELRKAGKGKQGDCCLESMSGTICLRSLE